ncbi:branched-chain amino acid ABC transporter permease/ATP-binding protein [Gordonia alkanivorans]|uniref:branched-chain amino acid ABC transporter permease/ATP-binding protein n=2 Tax=Gordonia alkanivorans TaxID=84096 RepID=UPI00244757B6|nr:branched-chain amino acid ABC transporter permease/ATP-binding protein [Gordonia alkanivorans]MDH3020608.1 branched-chain amino acid ABC transporter permease/ATP-binding protein [Gordonia alkanivorans]MDJ0007374.1 branched-chain amino acid ABC transporter permease/ATP-binding protein [Gordonia alkanivorans]MDJ0099840.1 branched-chain amino acid ABC transporter permease/ATP-binding protein [Gordonia alkanivorans]MDJ0492876.1 branched-chain amino acid ABC transporter permease/ATP-binding prote
MTQDIQFLLLGLGNGAVYAALALALVMTYRSSGVVNFATGAIALYIAYTYAYLRDGELLLIPIPGFPKTIDLGGPLGLAPAMVIALLIAAGLGALLYLCVFRMLRTAPATAKAVASIAVMLVIQALLAARVGTSPVSVDAILPTDIIEIGDIRVPADRVWIAALVVVLTVLLILAFRLTRFGLATRAAAESEKGAIVAGLSPERIAYANWALSTMIAGLAGILIAPTVPLIPVSYTLFIVPALAAALVANFSAIGPAVAAGLGIGVLQSEMTHLQASVSWMPQSGMAELIPLAMILIFLVVRGKPLPTRGAIIQNTLGAAPRPRNLLIPGIVGVVVALGFLIFTEGSIRGAVIVTFTVAIIALSQVVVTGFAGQISLAQLTLAGVAAYTMSRLTTDWGVPFPIAPVLAALAATVVGVVVGLPALRIRGLPVAVVTLSLAVFLEAFWFRNNEFNGGIDGAVVKDPSLFGLDLGIGSGSTYPNIAFGILCLIVLTLVGLGVARLRTSRLGASMLAVRANERSAAAAGVNVSRTKLVAFAIGAFIAGIGGSLMAYQQTVVVPESYAAIAGIGMFALVYLAGVTCVSGGVLAGIMGAGGILFVLLDRAVNLGAYYHVITGVLLVITIIANPEGIISEVHKATNWLRNRIFGNRKETDADLDLALSSGTDTTVEGFSRAPGEVILSSKGIGVRYGGVTAVENVSFDVRDGEIIGLIGPNGAGKTTFIDAISGFADATGSVSLDGDSLDGQRPYQRSRRGLGRTFQGIELYDDLSVRENVAVGATAARHRPNTATLGDDDLERLFELLHLTPVVDRQVKELSQGQRQLVSVARALAGRPRVVLLDEPAAGLDSTESVWLGHRLRAIRDAGVTVVMIDHDMELVLAVCDRIVVLDLGKVIAIGTPDEIRTDPAVASAYLGATHSGEELKA